MDLLLYEPEDFASDESYLRYYFRLNAQDIAFWQSWISNNPAKLDCIINADQLINLLSLQLDESELSHEYQRLMSAITGPSPDQASSATTASFPQIALSLRSFSTGFNRVPAKRLIQILSVVAVIIFAASVYLYLPTSKKTFAASGNSADQKDHLLSKVNNGQVPMKLKLEDGSIITLQPGSALDYPRNFLPSKREVFLNGEAFFEVSKNKTRPFYVYCQNLVAHVLGTSFNIRTDKNLGKIEVAVTTGKVEVYEKYKEVVNDQNNKSNGLILTPNQKAVYLEEDNKFESSLVDVPLPISYVGPEQGQDSSVIETIYAKPTPMSEIIKTLGKDYGIEIEVENDNLNNCHFSGPLPDMNLYLKLDAICQMVNASYEVKGTKILIRGIGCN